MIGRLGLLSAVDLETLRTTMTFIEGRLEERVTTEWALGLTRQDLLERAAVSEVLEQRSRDLKEPWRTAWRLINETWEAEIDEDDHDHVSFEVARRVREGEISVSLVDAIVKLVRPWLRASNLDSIDRLNRRQSSKPKSVADLLSLSLRSGQLVTPSALNLDLIRDRLLIFELATALDAAVTRGIASVERTLSPAGDAFWRYGDLARVYFVSGEGESHDKDPDAFCIGIAPGVKLLHYSVERSELEAQRVFAAKWGAAQHPIYRRLWAAIARDPAVVDVASVAKQVNSVSIREFWDLYSYPEFSELRAARFKDLDEGSKLTVLARIKKGPPAGYWPSRANRERVRDARDYWIAREFRRLQLGGAQLPPRQKDWLRDRLHRFPEIAAANSLQFGFRESSEAMWIRPEPDERYDFVAGAERLKLLETALTTKRAGWDHDPDGRAADWIRKDRNSDKLIKDFEEVPRGSGDYPSVWERFGWTHAPTSEPDSQHLGARVLALISGVPQKTLIQAINGLSHWMDTWANALATEPLFFESWKRLWPVAVEATNAQVSPDAEPSLSVVAESSDSEPHDLDTLNTPTGRLIGAFLHVCPTVKSGDRPFSDPQLVELRKLAVGTHGRSLLIVHHRLIEQISYFMLADPEWTQTQLVQPLLNNDNRSLMLWRAVARSKRSSSVIEVLGDRMAEMSVDQRLGRESRRSLIFNLIVDALHKLLAGEDPRIPQPKLQQAIRILDDEVRAHAADTISRFVREVATAKSSKSDANASKSFSAEELFRQAAKPFLEWIWPRDRSLVTPAVAKALADLPAVSGDAFSEAVETIEPLLVPFDAWSLRDYGVGGDDESGPKLRHVNTVEKAKALLRLLDATIGDEPRRRVPYDLADALHQIEKVSRRLADDRLFRRLAALLRK